MKTAKDIYFDTFGLCGCGNPTSVHTFLLSCLGATRDQDSPIVSVEKIRQIITEDPDGAAEFILHFLDDKELTEHGSSVFGSWHTEAGKAALELGPWQDDEDK